MANTFKFGNKNWAVKKDYVLAYNDENNNFKPLPFDFTRDSIATYVDSDGLIKTAGQGEPRIDYLDNADGHLLLEPARTNSFLQSNQFDTSYNLASGLTLTENSTTSPDGDNNAWKFESDGSSGFLQLNQIVSVTGSNTISIFAKKGTNRYISLRSLSGVDARGQFDLELGQVYGSNNSTASIEHYGNGWYRCSMSFSGTNNAHYFYPNIQGTADGGYIYIYGAQVEAGSYATSYIPTNGQSVTRAADDISLTLPNDSSFDSSNGFTIYGQFLTNGGSGTSSNFIDFTGNTGYAGFGSTGVTWRGRANNGTTNQLHNSAASITTTSKLSVSFDGNGYSMYANGTSFNTGSTDFSTVTSIDSISFRNNTEEFGSMQIRELKIYNTRLTDAELITLTQV